MIFKRYKMLEENMYLDNTDKSVWIFLDLMLIFLSSSTLAYEVVLFSKLPLWTCYPFFAVTIGVQLFFWLRLNNASIRTIKIDSNTISLIALGIFCSLFNVFTLRPDADDFSFFHRAIYGLLNLEAPISTFHTAFDLKNLPQLSPVHLMTSVEVMTALFAHALGVQPLFFYQILNGSFCLFLFPLIYYVFFRYFEFSHSYSYAGVIIVVMLYVFSGDSHQDFGNFTIVRAWQGKCILILLFVPLTALLTHRFIHSFSSQDILRLYLVALASIGLSGTAFFLVPFIIAFSLLGSTLTQWNQPNYFKKITLSGTTIIPFAIFAGLIKLGLLPQIFNTDVWQVSINPDVHKNIRPEILILEQTIFVKKTTLYFYLISVSGVFIFPWKNKTIRELGIASLFVSCSLIFPPISNILIKITLPGAYWRLAYATQILLIIGVFTLLCLKGMKENSRFTKATQRIFGICFLASFAALKSPAVKPAIISWPHQVKFNPSEIEFAKLLDNWMPDNSTALIPEELVPVVGLIRPDTNLISTRYPDTLHVFLNSGHKNGKNEVEVRLAAQKDLGTCGANGKVAQIVTEIPSLNLLVFPSTCDPKVIESTIQIRHEDWMVKSAVPYQVWLKIAQ